MAGPPRRTIDYVLAAIDDLTERALWLDRERQEAEQYAALGSSSELDVPITGSAHSDRVAYRAVTPDAYAQACARILHAMEVTLRRTHDRYRWDRDPAREAAAYEDAKRGRRMRDDHDQPEGENGDAA
jgi:hypothetical protein